MSGAEQSVEQMLGVSHGSAVSAPGSSCWPMDWRHRLAYWAYGLTLFALTLLTEMGPRALFWLVPLLILPLAFMGWYQLHNWEVVANGEGIALQSRGYMWASNREPDRWIPWSDVLCVRWLYGARGAKNSYHITCATGCIILVESEAARRIAQTAEAVSQWRAIGVAVPTNRTMPALPSAGSVSRATPDAAQPPAAAVSRVAAPVADGEADQSEVG